MTLHGNPNMIISLCLRLVYTRYSIASILSQDEREDAKHGSESDRQVTGEDVIRFQPPRTEQKQSRTSGAAQQSAVRD